MGKKYLSLEEAADRLGLSPDELTRYREEGDIRGFADRGNWKFREQDIDEFARSQQADSSPDIPIITDPGKAAAPSDALTSDTPASDSDVRLSFDESLFDDDGSGLDNSDSDVRLSGDSGPKLEGGDSDDSDSDVTLAAGSDSDVNLVGGGTEADMDLVDQPSMSDSDSDVLLADGSGTRLSDSDSDVRLTDQAGDDSDPSLISEVDSDSDVKLMGTDDLLADDSDSDVEMSPGLARTDSDIRLVEDQDSKVSGRKQAAASLPDDSDLKLISPDSKTASDEPDSGLTLQPSGSSANIEADESGISLEVDSGISFSADDSGISLESFDSGASLGADDSGISLDGGDSGISLDFDDSGIALEDEGDMGRTMPLEVVPGAADALRDSGDKTAVDIPAKQSGHDSEFELAGLDDDDDDPGASTSVLRFEDEDEDADSGQTLAVPALAAEEVGAATDEEVFGGETDDEFEDDFDDDQLDDVHDAEDFEEEFVDEGQESGFAAPAGPRAFARAEPEWGWHTKTGIGISAVLAVLCSVVGVELVRTMWIWTQPGTQEPSAVLELFGQLF